MHPRYEEDTYAWAMNTAELLRQRRLDELDFENLIEEIETLGRSTKHQLINRLAVLMTHLLKWQFQKGLRGHSWKYTIKEQRLQIRILLEENPSLKYGIEEMMRKAYEIAFLKVQKETGLDEEVFPTEIPYTFVQCLNNEFYPE
jgi:hypothetical protein